MPFFFSYTVTLRCHWGNGGLEVGDGAREEEQEEKKPKEKKDMDKESGVGKMRVERIFRCNCTMDSP